MVVELLGVEEVVALVAVEVLGIGEGVVLVVVFSKK